MLNIALINTKFVTVQAAYHHLAAYVEQNDGNSHDSEDYVAFEWGFQCTQRKNTPHGALTHHSSVVISSTSDLHGASASVLATPVLYLLPPFFI